MERARIYKPNRSTMQAGRAKSNNWVLEFEPRGKRYLEPIMGWTGTQLTKTQLQLRFQTKEEAIAYAKRNNIDFILVPPHQFRQLPKSYSHNFAADKVK